MFSTQHGMGVMCNKLLLFLADNVPQHRVVLTGCVAKAPTKGVCDHMCSIGLGLHSTTHTNVPTHHKACDYLVHIRTIGNYIYGAVISWIHL